MVIERYDPQWPALFDTLSRALDRQLKTPHRIHHIGSTSIPGMWAKPIIDVNIEIDSPGDFAAIRRELEAVGYFHNGDQGIPGREVFKRKPVALPAAFDSINHHLYVCVHGAREHTRNLLFRDYLRRHPEYVEQYNNIKFEILGKHGTDDRAQYVDIKEKEYRWFFEDVIGKALSGS